MKLQSFLYTSILSFLLLTPCWSRNFAIDSQQVYWQQYESKPSFHLTVEREDFSTLDRVGRMVFAVQAAKEWKLDELTVRWRVKRGDDLIAENLASIKEGLLDVSFTLSDLKPGRFDVSGELLSGEKVLLSDAAFFNLKEAKAPPQSGRIGINLPRGVPGKSTFPVTTGVPFPKGALWSKDNVRLVKANGTRVPATFAVRSRWGHRDESSIRWLGVDFQAEPSSAWWPQRKDTKYFLEYGPGVKAVSPQGTIAMSDTPDGIEVNTGPLQFTVRRQGFNLLDNVRLNGKQVLSATNQDGLYLVDHEGSTYRAANDRETKLTVEESTSMRVVLRAEGWYVKDGTAGENQHFSLPTDKLCRFVTRLEAYAGKPYVRVLNTSIITYDIFSVRLRDVGISLPLQAATAAQFGIEGEPRSRPAVEEGVRLVQHLPHEFVIEDNGGKNIRTGEHSAGWVLAETPGGVVGISNRDTWQRFPKELEVLPDAIKLHVWPAHGRDHPQIEETDHKQIHKLWFAHQGRELNLRMPWEYYFKVVELAGGTTLKPNIANPSQALWAIHSGALGASVSSDFLLTFAAPSEDAAATQEAETFQAAPHALPDTKWLCDSLAMGYVHPYDPQNYTDLEAAIEGSLRGYWETQDYTDLYGMWVYRTWHGSGYEGDGKWSLHRVFNGTHHYEAFMPWMLYARSGDPFYLTQGWANMRMLTDVQMVHHEEVRYPKEITSQRPLIGATKHDNSLVPWGGDHAVLGHPTCYNALMLAYYLTGDLRLCEIVVDEWQNTILTKNHYPENIYRADQSKPHDAARNRNNALGELIDLYQMTYHPAVLARMNPLLEAFPKNMWHWGQPLHNVLLFRGSEQLRNILLEGAAQYRKAGLQELHKDGSHRKVPLPAHPSNLWGTHAPHENFALAAIVAPEKGYDAEAYEATNPVRMQSWAAEYLKVDEPVTSMGMVPDYVIYLPRVMYAMARAGAKGGEFTYRDLAFSQPLPFGGALSPEAKGWLRAIVREDKDREFTVNVTGNILERGVPVQIFGPDNKLISQTIVPPGIHSPYRIKVPADGRTGQYVIFILPRVGGIGNDELYVPLTNLPGEVYDRTAWYQLRPSFFGKVLPTRFFTRSRTDQPESIEVEPDKGSGFVTNRDGSKVLAQTTSGEKMKIEMGPQGAWLVSSNPIMYVRPEVIISTTPDRWFLPEDAKLNLLPGQID